MAALSIALILSVARDAVLLWRHPVAVGVDGYYYVLQIDELLKHGHLYFPTNTPLVFYALAGVSALTGDVISAIKISSLVLHAALCCGVYALVSAVTRDPRLGLLGSALTALPTMHLYMVTEFVKNLGALTLLVWSAWSAVRASQSRHIRWVVGSLVSLAAAVFSHRSAWAITLSLFTLVLTLRCLTIDKHLRCQTSIVLLTMAALCVSPMLVAVQPFVELPRWLAAEVLASPKWFINSHMPFGKSEMLALLLIAPAALLLVIRHRRVLPTYEFGLVMGTVAAWSLLVTVNPFLNHDVRQHGIAARLGHLAYVQVAILTPGIICLLLRIYRRSTLLVLTSALVLLAVGMRSSLPEGLRSSVLLTRERMIGRLPALRSQLGANPVIVARHGDQFVVTWVLDVPSQQRFPEEASSRSVYWLLHRAQCRSIRPSMTVIADEASDSCLMLTKHDDLMPWFGDLTEDERSRLIRGNPHLGAYFSRDLAPGTADRQWH